MDQLQERKISFLYDYKMRCGTCGGATPVSSQDYWNQVDESRVPCDRCGTKIHFGRAVAALQDPRDPALTDEQAASFAWYHSSTVAQWPTVGPIFSPSSAHLGRLLSPESLARAVRRHADQALHVGTYEAALENMLRRMRDQGDGGTTFYLHRVELSRDLQLEAGYRDENVQAAARITQTEIRESGSDGIRYLNAHEAQGSISIALHRNAIVAIQSISLPVAGLREQLSSATRREAERLYDTIQDLAPGPRSVGDRLAGLVGDGPGDLEYWDAKTSLRACLMREWRDALSPVVADAFERALWKWEDDPAAFGASLDQRLDRWAATAALLVNPGAVLDRLRSAAVRRFATS